MSDKIAKRFGYVIHVQNKEKMAEYKRLHADVWPEVLKRLKDSNLRNYTIYFSDNLNLMFSHIEYIGDDLDGDMKAIPNEPAMREWWKLCEPVQKPVQWEDSKPPSEGGKGDWWFPMEEVFHDGLSATAYKEKA